MGYFRLLFLFNTTINNSCSPLNYRAGTKKRKNFLCVRVCHGTPSVAAVKSNVKVGFYRLFTQNTVSLGLQIKLKRRLGSYKFISKNSSSSIREKKEFMLFCDVREIKDDIKLQQCLLLVNIHFRHVIKNMVLNGAINCC